MDDYDPTDLAGTEQRKAERARETRAEIERKDADLRHVMSKPQGRRFVWDQLSDAGVYRSSFHTVLAQMAFNEGSRSRGLDLLARCMRACPDRYQEMVNEHRKPDPKTTKKPEADASS